MEPSPSVASGRCAGRCVGGGLAGGSVAEPGESGGGEEEWEVRWTAADEGEVKRVGWRLDRQTTPHLHLCTKELRNEKVKKRPQDPGTKHRNLGHPAEAQRRRERRVKGNQRAQAGIPVPQEMRGDLTRGHFKSSRDIRRCGQRAWVMTQLAKECHSAVLPRGRRICSTKIRKAPAQRVARWILRVDQRS